MFSKARETIEIFKTPPAAAPPSRSSRGPDQRRPSILASNIRLFGDIRSEGDVHVEGEVTGSIHCRALTLAQGAKIEGNITCKMLEVSTDAFVNGDVRSDEVKLHGSIEGHLTARSVHLNSSAKMLGNIVHESLSIDQGAHLNGECRHTEEVVRLLEAPAEKHSVKAQSATGDALPRAQQAQSAKRVDGGQKISQTVTVKAQV